MMKKVSKCFTPKERTVYQLVVSKAVLMSYTVAGVILFYFYQGCSRRRKRRLVDHNPSNETMTYTTSHWLHIEDKNKAKTLLNSKFYFKSHCILFISCIYNQIFKINR